MSIFFDVEHSLLILQGFFQCFFDKGCTVFPSVYLFMSLKELRVLSFPRVHFLCCTLFRLVVFYLFYFIICCRDSTMFLGKNLLNSPLDEAGDSLEVLPVG